MVSASVKIKARASASSGTNSRSRRRGVSRIKCGPDTFISIAQPFAGEGAHATQPSPIILGDGHTETRPRKRRGSSAREDSLPRAPLLRARRSRDQRRGIRQVAQSTEEDRGGAPRAGYAAVANAT